MVGAVVVVVPGNVAVLSNLPALAVLVAGTMPDANQREEGQFEKTNKFAAHSTFMDSSNQK